MKVKNFILGVVLVIFTTLPENVDIVWPSPLYIANFRRNV